MTLLGLLILLLIAALAGSIGMSLAGFLRGGCLAAIVVGFIGAWLGTWVAGQVGLPPILVINVEGQPFPFVWAVIGALLFAIVLGLLTRRPRY